MSAKTSISIMAKHGFTVRSTGGNCTAYVRDHGDMSEWVTLYDDPSIPTARRDKVRITEVMEDDTEANVETGYTFGQVLDALEYSSDECVLLAMRLDNGFHKGGR